MPTRLVALGLLVTILTTACGDKGGEHADSVAFAGGRESKAAAEYHAPGDPPIPARAGARAFVSEDLPYGPAPLLRSGPLDPAVEDVVEDLFANLEQKVNLDSIRAIGEAGDARLAWLLADLLRFIRAGDMGKELVNGFEKLTGAKLVGEERRFVRAWSEAANHLIAWDIPAPPNYVRYKWRLYALLEPGWEPFFTDIDADIDWRWITWAGVQIDDRELGDPRGCSRDCVPAIDDPGVTGVKGAVWYADDEIVFGVVVNDEARAYPKHIMEVHEMVNDTLGGRRIGMLYCTLCGSAQAYFTDSEEKEIVLRTSGLLSRSNKVIYDLTTLSVLDAFTGKALSGPLQDGGVVLEQVTVFTSTWGEWKEAYPNTRIVAEDGGIGRVYPLDPLQGRDANGPIFPVGYVDPRLAVQDRVVGVIAPDGTPLAFPTVAIRIALSAGEVVELDGVFIESSAGGFRAVDAAGMELVAHEAFWFAWSQFMLETEIWESSAP